MNRIGKIIAFILCIFAVCGCTKKENIEVTLELTTYKASDGKISEIPQFKTTTSEYDSGVNALNAESDRLLRMCTLQDTNAYVQSDVHQGKKILQVTSWWYEMNLDGTPKWNLCSLAYDKENNIALNCSSVLKNSEITGIQLTMDVNSAYVEQKLPGRVQETEMQGFYLSEEGKTEKIYMKLVIGPEDDPAAASTSEIVEAVENFYSYDIKSKKLTPMSEVGYELP